MKNMIQFLKEVNDYMSIIADSDSLGQQHITQLTNMWQLFLKIHEIHKYHKKVNVKNNASTYHELRSSEVIFKTNL